MQYRVSGVDADSGRPMQIQIEAESLAQAETIAQSRNIEVTDISAVTSGPPTYQRASNAGKARARGAARGASGSGSGVQTIEATAKSWKLLMLLGGIALVIGLLAFVVAFSGDKNSASDLTWVAVLGILCWVIGVPLYLLGRFGAWWFHG